MKMVARIIGVRGQLGLTKQIFFCNLGGFDTHGAQVSTQGPLLQQLSQAIYAFYQATLELIMSEDFEVDRLPASVQAIFDSTRAKLLFQSDVFWARASIGDKLLDLWLDTYQTSRSFGKRGIVELELP
jgi:hypothetical protein